MYSVCVCKRVKGYCHLAVEQVLLVVCGAESVQILLQLQQVFLHLFQALLKVFC